MGIIDQQLQETANRILNEQSQGRTSTADLLDERLCEIMSRCQGWMKTPYGDVKYHVIGYDENEEAVVVHVNALGPDYLNWRGIPYSAHVVMIEQNDKSWKPKVGSLMIDRKDSITKDASHAAVKGITEACVRAWGETVTEDMKATGVVYGYLRRLQRQLKETEEKRNDYLEAKKEALVALRKYNDALSQIEEQQE